MSITYLRIASAIIFFVFIFSFGFWLRKAGKPYNGILLNVHKLISIAAVILFGVTVFQISKASGLTSNELTATVVTGILLLSTIISGGLTSINTMPVALLRMHQVTLILATISSAITFYILLR
jgi:hypothetical protein